jgi:hypothetical protein
VAGRHRSTLAAGWLPWRLLVVVAAFYIAASLSGALDALQSLA